MKFVWLIFDFIVFDFIETYLFSKILNLYCKCGGKFKPKTIGKILTYGISDFRYLHRIDGPAVIYPDGNECWFVRNESCSTWKQFQELSKVSDEELSILILKYGSI